jgi:hypothetical protein
MLRRSIRLAAPVLACLAASCAQIPDPPIVSRAVDPTSPAAQRVLRAAEEARDAPYPTFQDAPSYSTDVRAPAAWNAAVRDVKAAGTALDRWRAANPAELTDTEQFARTQRQAVGDVSNLPTAPTPEESAEYARQQRQRAEGR